MGRGVAGGVRNLPIGLRVLQGRIGVWYAGEVSSQSVVIWAVSKLQCSKVSGNSLETFCSIKENQLQPGASWRVASKYKTDGPR